MMRRAVSALAALALLVAPTALAAQATARIDGEVVDAASGAPVPGATVRLRELGRRETSHADGAFHFERVAPGEYTVVAERIGYAPVEATVRVAAGGAAQARLLLQPTALQIAGVVATGTPGERGGAETYRPTTVLGGAELRRRLAATVPATLAGEPGVAQSYNGPGASQPVIRGLSGDRVLVLEDGHRSGDIAGSAADHGVMVDPLTAERIEVLRGPAAILYGGNTLGGVVNVIREEVPRSLPDRLGGVASFQGESAAMGGAAGAALTGAHGVLAWRAEAGGRLLGDTRTPLGTLESSDLRALNLGAGLSRVGPAGYAGLAVRDYEVRYGVPGDFNGVQVPGGHEGGVYIRARRTAVRGEAELRRDGGPFRGVRADLNLVRFDHRERERDEEGAEFDGTTFLQHLGTLNVVARHAHGEGTRASQGAVGIWAMGRDLDVAGSSTGSRSARQFQLAGFGWEEVGLGPLRLELGARYDWTLVSPNDRRSVGGVEVDDRSFGALSGSAAVVGEMGAGWQVGARLARAFRTPSVEELFSRGPHLASFSYEIGNPELDAETGLGTDLFLRIRRTRLDGEVTVYRNAIDGFIYYAPTGDLDPRFGRYPVYRARGDDAVFHGAEARVQWEPVRRWAVEAGGSLVRAEARIDGEDRPLPAIPPAQGRLRLRYDVPGWFAEVGTEFAARQERVGEFETPTGGHTLLNAGAGLRWERGGRLHTLTLQGDNLTDRTWRDHLSRLKEVAPQPGVNLRLLYRVDF